MSLNCPFCREIHGPRKACFKGVISSADLGYIFLEIRNLCRSVLEQPLWGDLPMSMGEAHV